MGCSGVVGIVELPVAEGFSFVLSVGVIFCEVLSIAVGF